MELSKESLEAAQEVEKKKKAEIFIAEYQDLCNKHGMALQAIAQWQVVEIQKPKTEPETKPEENDKPGDEEPAITVEVEDGKIIDNEEPDIVEENK